MVISGFIRRVVIPKRAKKDKHFFKALKDKGMEFCIFCNAAIATLYALEIGQIKQVEILE